MSCDHSDAMHLTTNITCSPFKQTKTWYCKIHMTDTSANLYNFFHLPDVYKIFHLTKIQSLLVLYVLKNVIIYKNDDVSILQWTYLQLHLDVLVTYIYISYVNNQIWRCIYIKQTNNYFAIKEGAKQYWLLHSVSKQQATGGDTHILQTNSIIMSLFISSDTTFLS